MVSVTADLNGRALFAQVLDFLEEVLLASASGEGSEESILGAARRLLGAMEYILKILDTLRSLVSDSDIGGMGQQKCDPVNCSGRDVAGTEVAFLADRPRRRERWGPSLIPDRRPSRTARADHGMRSSEGRDLHGLPSYDLGRGQVLLWPKDI